MADEVDYEALPSNASLGVSNLCVTCLAIHSFSSHQVNMMAGALVSYLPIRRPSVMDRLHQSHHLNTRWKIAWPRKN